MLASPVRVERLQEPGSLLVSFPLAGPLLILTRGPLPPQQHSVGRFISGPSGTLIHWPLGGPAAFIWKPRACVVWGRGHFRPSRKELL